MYTLLYRSGLFLESDSEKLSSSPRMLKMLQRALKMQSVLRDGGGGNSDVTVGAKFKVWLGVALNQNVPRLCAVRNAILKSEALDLGS